MKHFVPATNCAANADLTERICDVAHPRMGYVYSAFTANLRADVILQGKRVRGTGKTVPRSLSPQALKIIENRGPRRDEATNLELKPNASLWVYFVAGNARCRRETDTDPDGVPTVLFVASWRRTGRTRVAPQATKTLIQRPVAWLAACDAEFYVCASICRIFHREGLNPKKPRLCEALEVKNGGYFQRKPTNADAVPSVCS